MNSFTITSISSQPIRKDVKAPFVASALIFDGVVGFCLRDFCSQILEQYKKNLVSNLSPEYVFARLVVMLSKYKYRHHGRKLSLELMMMMNSPYRPWYICDKDPAVIKLLHDAGIDLSSDAYDAFPEIVKGGIRHPYLALVLNQHLSDKMGLEDFYYLDAFTLVGNIRHLFNKKSIYRTCVEIGYFKRDEVLLQLFEFLVEGLDRHGHGLLKFKNAVDQLTRELHYLLGSKSQLLILKCYSLGSRNPCFKTSTYKFESSINYSVKNDYKVPFYRLVASSAIMDGDKKLFDVSIGALCSVLGESSPIVKSLLNQVRGQWDVEQLDKPEPIGYQALIEQGLQIGEKIRVASSIREVKYCHSHHLLSPSYSQSIPISEASTLNLVNLMILISSLDKYCSKSDRLDRVSIQSMYPDLSVAWWALTDLIGSKVIKLDLKAFEKIPVKALDNIGSYLGMRFKLNLDRIWLDEVDCLDRIKHELKTRPDLGVALLTVWNKYAESHFYSAIVDYAPQANHEVHGKRDISTQFKVSLCKCGLSASILRHIAYLSLVGATKPKLKPTSAEVLRSKSLFSLNLTRYLNEAVRGGV